MKKYFVVSDIHSFFKPLKTSLDSSGFDIENKNHVLIVVGDIFDRGYETIAVYEFLKSIPKSRLILIKGNHEQLYLDLLSKKLPDSYDFSNGTVRTFCAIAQYSPELTKYDIMAMSDSEYASIWKSIVKSVKVSEITKFIKSTRWKDYFELDSYIFTHSFIPLEITDPAYAFWPTRSIPNRFLKPKPNWRTDASKLEWEDARWGCPWGQFRDGLFDEEIKNNKILVCGHWHTSDFHYMFEENYVDEAGAIVDQGHNYTIYFSKNLIGLDGCVARTSMQNVLVIDDDKCYDQKLKELKVAR